MQSTYLILKFLHVVGAIVWIGATCALTVLYARIARERDVAALSLLSRHGGFLGGAVMAPSAATTLVAGIAMVAISGLTFHTFWIVWGFAGIFVSWLLLGATFLRKTMMQLHQLAPTATPDDPRLQALQRRLSMLNVINLLVLLSVVWAMVYKPTL